MKLCHQEIVPDLREQVPEPEGQWVTATDLIHRDTPEVLAGVWAAEAGQVMAGAWVAAVASWQEEARVL